jgi:GMP synthase (glutamine-hydrolysing)
MEGHAHPKSIVILDFGGQYAHLIGTRVRSFGAYSEILPPETPAAYLKGAAGIILSGGPQSVYEKGSPQADPEILTLGIPVLGLCYGLQWMAQALGGTVEPGHIKEYGRKDITIENGGGTLLSGFGKVTTVWMSHGDEATMLPTGFTLTASSDSCRHAAFEDANRKLFALQFHPEVLHTEKGSEILKRFVALCNALPWSVGSYKDHISAQIKKEAGDRNVFMLVSGGVDSTVAFTLLNAVLGPDRVQGLLVDTGLMRKNEVPMIRNAFSALGVTNLRIVDASEEFFAALKGITDPEEKRKAIGDTFLRVQERVSKEMNLSQYTSTPVASRQLLGQGTIYPDTIETKGTKHADHIKTHHNRVAAIQKMIEEGRVIEPLKDLYKDEVRQLGEELGLPHELVWRHPFPGPGLGVRILCANGETADWRLATSGLGNLSHAILPIRSVGVQGDGRTYRHAVVLFKKNPAHVESEHWKLATEIPNKHRDFNRVLLCLSDEEPITLVSTEMFVTRERADLLREADAIVDDVMREARLYEHIWQFPVVLLPLGTKSGGQAIVLRPVESTEAMTANAAHLPENVLKKMTEKLLALPGVDTVFYDLTSKPPATIEWE